MMIDKENVITHLQIINTWAVFAREHDLQFFTAKHLEDIVSWTDDALVLLKEQEAVEPIEIGYEIDVPYPYWCGNCGSHIQKRQIYCDRCGRAVKWN